MYIYVYIYVYIYLYIANDISSLELKLKCMFSSIYQHY